MAPGPMEVSAAVLWCSERRLRGLRGRFMAFMGIETADPILIPGGVTSIVMPRNPRDADFIIEMIETLHYRDGLMQLYVMAHIDCVACNNNRDPTFYKTLLVEARKTLCRRLSYLEIMTVFVDFDGVHLVEPEEVNSLAAV